MITELHIENLGVIERTSLRFGPGLTVLTGETGAGKTMLVEAIELLVGERADSTVVRTGADEARIDGRVVVADAGGDSDETVLTRAVPATGRSRAYVDGRPATASHLAELCRPLIDLHGQHAHQSLLSPATQRAALDAFAGVDLEPLRAARAAVTELDAELATLGGDERTRAREIDLLRYQVDELDRAGIGDPGEDAILAVEEATLADATAHREAAAGAVEAIAGDDAIAERLDAVIRALSGREPFDGLVDRLSALSAELTDVGALARDLADTIDEDPQRLDEVRERRQLLVDLRRKYGDSLADVVEFHRQAAGRLLELERYEQRAAELDAARRTALQRVADEAGAVARVRRAAAARFSTAVAAQLEQLALAGAALAIEFNGDADDLAADRLQIVFAANAGAPLLPLNRVASGGELARTMLAVRLVLAGIDARDGASGAATGGPTTLVFDEVDAGIGGAAAVAVGEALARLAIDHQVMVVTHLPQVAAVADTHAVITKRVAGGAANTDVAVVDGDDRVREIARMLAGDDHDAAVEHARSLLARAGSRSAR